MHKNVLAALMLGVVGIYRPASAYEWQTPCGTSKNAMQTCTERKGDVVLNGKQGYSHMYIMPDGKRYQWFYPRNAHNTLCDYSDNFLKMPGGSWFSVNPECTSDGFIRFQLPSGNYAFFVERTVP